MTRHAIGILADTGKCFLRTSALSACGFSKVRFNLLESLRKVFLRGMICAEK
jgi:hypothetical protein